MKPAVKLSILALTTLALFFIAVCIGPTHLLNFSKLLSLLFNNTDSPDLAKASIVLWELRLPRVLLAAAAGINLALGGILLQAIFRNPLAEPYLLGISSGGALGAVIAVSLGASFIMAPALVGSLLFAALILLICRHRLSADLASLLLAGIALGALAQALTTALILRFDPGSLRSILFWLMGSFAGAGWPNVWIVAIPAVLGLLLTLFLHRPLDILTLGSESAHHLGIRVFQTQSLSIALASILAAFTVASCGTIGFIGLMAPHIARRINGPSHAFAIPTAALIGASLTITADLVVRSLPAGIELPVGVVTGAFGCAFFLALILRKR